MSHTQGITRITLHPNIIDIDQNGYVKVNLEKEDGTINSKYLHKLMAKAYVPNPNDCTIVHHKDGNKKNNAVSNLEWIAN